MQESEQSAGKEFRKLMINNNELDTRNLPESYRLLLERRSVRAYEKTPLTSEQIDLILLAASYAPSGHGRQPFAFLAVSDPQVITKLSKLNADVMRQTAPDYEGDPFYGAPCVFAVLVKKDVQTGKLDGAAAMENMLLAAASLRLGGCWINRAKEVFETAAGQEILVRAGFENPENLEGIGFVIAGTPKDGALRNAAPRKAQIGKLL